MGFIPALFLGATVLGGVVKAKNQGEAADFQAQQYLLQGKKTQLQSQQAVAGLEASARATAASATPALATARAATYNADIAKQNAALELQAGAEQERRYRVSAESELADTRASIAASGVEVSGSALDALANSAANSELNALTIRHDSVVKANAFLNSETLDHFQAAQAQSQADFIGQQADYIRSTIPAVQQGYAMDQSGYQLAAARAKQEGRSASASTLLDTTTKALGTSTGQNFLGDLLGL